MDLARTLFFTTVLLVLCLAGTSESHALSVQNIRFGQHTGKVRMVLDLDGPASYRVFTLGDPWRLVIDMPAFAWEVGSLERPPYTGVTDIRKGQLDEKISRIVVDLNAPLTIKSVFFLPRSGGTGDRLVIDFSSASVAEAMTQKGRVFGTLEMAPEAAITENVVMIPPAAPEPPAQKPPLPDSAPMEEGEAASAPLLAHEDTPPHPAPEGPKPPEIQTAASSMIIPSRKPARKVYEKSTIIIDAGHGGDDPGAVGPDGIKEKEITLSMARELKRQLEATGRYEVKLTRDNDTYLRLSRRVDIARQAKGDLFISLHADSIGKSVVRGASIYTLSEKASDEETAELAVRENLADVIGGVDLSGEDEIVVNILVDLAMRDTMNQSKFLANTTVDVLQTHDVETLENPHRFAGFAVLKAPDIPSILIEMGFLSNKSEARMLASSSFQKKLAQALVASIDAYFEKIRQSNRT